MANEQISYQKELPVKIKVDVFIAGGGPAGIAAGVTAAREGKSVFIAESFSAFGGAAVTMLVPAFMPFGDKDNFYAGGIGREVRDSLTAYCSERWQKYCPDGIPAEALKRLYDDMVNKSGAKYMFHCSIIDAVKENDEIKYVICAAKGSVFAVSADIFIDCTGDGDLSHFAGAESEFGDENGLTMATTLCGIWSGINWSKVKPRDARRLDDAFRDNVFTNKDYHLPGMWRLCNNTEDENGTNEANGVGGSNAGHVYGIDARYAESLTEGVVEGRRQLGEYADYYKNYLEGFEKMELVATGSLGIRESRRIICDYRLVLQDFIDRAVFEDEIGRYNYCVDIHSATNDDEGYQKFASEHASLRYKSGESYGIPYRTLTVKGIKNLLVAGRCICTDRHMQSSVRVMPGCYITGQAAGMAASVLKDAGSTDVHLADVHEIQKRLVKMGAFLPNFRD